MQDQRVIYNTFDISQKVNDFRLGDQAFAYVAGGNLYVGSLAPFNNLWFDLGTLNSATTVPTVKIWWANSWHDAVDVADETDGMKQDGRISWNTDKDKSWDVEQTSELVSGLAAFKIYWKYWVRISWDVNFSIGTTLKYVGQKFSTDDILFSFYPDLAIAELLTGFQTGKTSWDEQHFMAAEHIIRDLKKSGVIKSRSQLLDWTLLQDASCHKVAEIVYQAFGKPYSEQLVRARAQYLEAINIKHFSADLNANGRLDAPEITQSSWYGTR